MKQPVLLTFNIPEAVTAKLRLICDALRHSLSARARS